MAASIGRTTTPAFRTSMPDDGRDDDDAPPRPRYSPAGDRRAPAPPAARGCPSSSSPGDHEDVDVAAPADERRRPASRRAAPASADARVLPTTMRVTLRSRA